MTTPAPFFSIYYHMISFLYKIVDKDCCNEEARLISHMQKTCQHLLCSYCKAVDNSKFGLF